MHKRRMLGLVLATAFVVAACGGDDGGSAFGGGGDADGGGSTEEFCAIAGEIEALDARIDANEINVLDPEQAETAFTELAGLVTDITDVAPEEIKADLEARAGDTETILAALEEVDFDVLALDPSLTEDTPERDAATERLDAYLETECGIVDDDTAENADPSDEEVQDLIEDSGRGSELAAQAFVAAGLPEDQAACLAEQVTLEQLVEAGSGGEPPAEFFTALEQCGVSLTQLAELGGATSGGDLGEIAEPELEDLIEEMPDISEMPDLPEDLGSGDIPDAATDIFVSTLIQQGFTQAEAECLAPTFLGGDAGADPLVAFENCGISLTRLAELGN